MSNYPLGAANDPSAPYNEPLTKYSKIKVEATVELGTMVDVEVEIDEDGYPCSAELLDAVVNKLRKKYNIDDKDTTLVDIHIWDWR